MRLDRLDIKILETLQKEGRITKVKLAERVGLSASPCLERLKKLENVGYIRRYGADISIEKLCSVSFVFAEMTLKSHTAQDFTRFEREIVKYPEVVDCYAVGGGIDYIVKFVTRSIQHYQEIIDVLLEENIGIERYFTYIVTKRIKTGGPLPITRLLAGEADQVNFAQIEPRDLPRLSSDLATDKARPHRHL